MSDSRMLFKLRSELARERRTCAALENLVVNQKALIERLISVACAATWDFAFGNPSPTDDEIQALAKEMAGAK